MLEKDQDPETKKSEEYPLLENELKEKINDPKENKNEINRSNLYIENSDLNKPGAKLDILDDKNETENKNPNKETFGRSVIFANMLNLNAKEKKLYPLYIISFCYLFFAIIELVCGYYSNSITLFADATHFFSESTCYLIYILSIYTSKKKTTSEMSFGFSRGEILGVLVSATVLWGFSFWLLYYVIIRFLNPEIVNGFIIIIFGIISAFFNLMMGLILMFFGIGNGISFKENEKICHHHHSDDELNCESIKLSFQHVVFTGLQSCLIILAGVLIYFINNITIIDPLCSLFLICILLNNAYNHLEGSIKILMEASPLEFDVDELENDLLGVSGVIEVHDIHVWSLSIGKISMSCHLTTSEPQNSLIKARELIKQKYNITHTTIQVELDTDKINVCKGNKH